jgi:hypothetical protein
MRKFNVHVLGGIPRIQYSIVASLGLAGSRSAPSYRLR